MEGLFQPTHLILILAIALLVFGPKKLPELGQGLGKGIRGFKDALKGSAKTPIQSREPIGSPPGILTETIKNGHDYRDAALADGTWTDVLNLAGANRGPFLSSSCRAFSI